MDVVQGAAVRKRTGVRCRHGSTKPEQRKRALFVWNGLVFIGNIYGVINIELYLGVFLSYTIQEHSNSINL